MRLSKRIAAVALAAVMAVSMLTACGGGGGSTGGSNSGNGGSNNGNNSSNVGGDTTDNGKDDGKNDTTLGPIDTNVVAKKTTWKDSRTGKFFGANGKIYIKYKGLYDGSIPAVFEMAGNTKTKDVYIGVTVDGIKCMGMLTDWKNNKEYEIFYKEIFNLKNDAFDTSKVPAELQGKDFYFEDNADQYTLRATLPSDNTEVEICTYEYPQNSGKKYYGEKLVNSDSGDVQIYCYNFTSGKLEMVVTINHLNQQASAQVYEEVKNNYPDSLMKLPEGAIKVTEKDLKDAELNK